jgi:DNA-binding response OmpR family regulator
MSTEPTQKKILIVDDDIAVTKLLGGVLTKQGYSVLVSHDGLDGMVQVRKSAPDLILLDIMMPEINGYDVCRDLKFDARFKHIPIIVMTSRDQELDSRIGQLMGIDYMHKPVDSKLLIEKINKTLNK